MEKEMKQKKDKRINKKKVFLIAVIITIIAIIVLTIYLLNKNKEDQSSQEINQEIEVGQFVSEIDMTDTTNSEIRDDGMKINTSNKIAEGIEFNDVFIKDIKIEATGDMATFNATVENNLGKDLEGYIIYLNFLDNEGNIIDKVETFFPDIPNGEIGFITATTPKDIATAYDLTIERDRR